MNAKDSEGYTLLMFAAGYNPNADVIGVLLGAAANVKAQDVIGRTPLMFAAENNPDPGVISTLLKAGADINARANGMLDYTALMYAAANNRNPVVATLLKAGADVKARDSFGGTALMKAASSNQEIEVVTTLLRCRIGSRSFDRIWGYGFLGCLCKQHQPWNCHGALEGRRER